ncbi:MAG TPA: mannonate dehydratase, partial [Acidimicrobiales bacterium]|nr:mannonate dehydratase [Acidimicrobiales bacterium]
WGLDLCLGTVSEMGGEAAVLDAVEWFGRRGEIVYVHLRDVRGYGERFEECFLGEGNYDPVLVLERLVDIGFDGFLLDDHTPLLVNDSPYGHRGRAHAIGYMQGILQTLERQRR